MTESLPRPSEVPGNGQHRPERVSFYEEQARRRRGTWRLAGLCMVVATGIGFVLSSIVTPLLLIIAGLVLRVAGWMPGLADVAASLRASLSAWAGDRLNALSGLVDSLSLVTDVWSLGILLPYGVKLASVGLPGMAAAALVWLMFRRILKRGGLADLAPSLGARPVRPDVLEERQLANVVDEMALAAGLPSPRVLVVDSEIANAAAIGSEPDDATILVTTGLMHRLDRDETSAVIGHLVGSIGHGDLAVATSALAVFHTLAFFLTVLDLPFRATARRALWHLAPVALGRAATPEALAKLEMDMETSMSGEASDDLGRVIPNEGMSLPAKLIRLPLLPFVLLTLFFKMVVILWVPLFLGPPLALVFGTRRYLADAASVQLTRDAAALTRALNILSQDTALPRGGEFRDFLFIHAPRMSGQGGLAHRRAIPASLVPTVEARNRRLTAMGSLMPAPPRAFGTAFVREHPAKALLLAVLVALLVPLVALLVVMVLFLTLFVMEVALLAGLMMSQWVLGGPVGI